MYSQYHYQDNGGTTTQTATSVQLTNLTWNGTQWVHIPKSNSLIQSSAGGSHQQQQQQQQQQYQHQYSSNNGIYVAGTKIPPPKTKLPPTPAHLKQTDESLMTLDQLVSHYSTIYHFYAKEVNSFNNINTVEGNKSKEWAVYHCDLSARAAHHYNDLLAKSRSGENINRTNIGGMAQAKAKEQQNDMSFENHQGPIVSRMDKSTTLAKSAAAKTKTKTKKSPSEQPPPESFRRYAHKNLLLCNTDTQRNAMQELLTLTMSNAIQKQEFYGTDWDYEPLLSIPGGDGEEKIMVPEKKCVKNEKDDLNPRDESCSENLKKLSNIKDQETTLNDWYGGNGEVSNTTDICTQSEACITFKPKVFKKKKKRNYRQMNSRNHEGTGDSKSQKNKNNTVINEFESQNDEEESPKKMIRLLPQDTVSERFDNSSGLDGEDTSRSFTLSRNSTQDQNFKSGTNTIEHQTTISKSHEQKGETTSECYGELSVETSTPCSTISPQKKEIDKQHQIQTLNDWYGCDKSTDGKSNNEAVITFKPKPLKKKKKKKKNRNYMKRSLAAANAKVSSAQENCTESATPSGLICQNNSSALLGNGITMLPQVQSDTKAIVSHHEKMHGDETGNMSLDGNNSYRYDEHSNPNDSNINMMSKMHSIRQDEDDHFIPLNKMSTEVTNPQTIHSGTRMNHVSSSCGVSCAGARSVDEDYSASFSNPPSYNTVEPQYIPQNKRSICGGNNFVAADHQDNTGLTNNHEKILGDGFNNESFASFPLTHSKNVFTKITNNSIYSSIVNNDTKFYADSNTKRNLSGFERSEAKLAVRASRFAEHDGINHDTLHIDYNQNADRYMGKSLIGGKSDKTLTEEDYENMTVKGFCQVLEKPYLRLTSPPRAEFVRPQRILSLHLANLKKKWLSYRANLYSTGKSNGGIADELPYTWFCSQLKAIRQDLTVQRIFNAFSVEVYETHAKIALQENDLNEYNQSQTQLKELYRLLSNQSPKNRANQKVEGLENENEFIAYRIIYYIFLTCNKKYNGGSSDLLEIMISLTPEQRKDRAIDHALKVRVAVAEHDYHAFFQLQDVCPNLGAYLMDTLVPQIRALGLKRMLKAYRPSVSIMFTLQELGFSVDEADVEVGRAWLTSCGCKFSNDRCMIMTKETILNENHLAGIRNSSLI